MASLTVTIVFSSDSSARTFGTKKVAPSSVRQMMPVNILRYIVKSPFIEIRASKFISSRNLVHKIERHSQYQTVWKTTARKGNTFSDLSWLVFFKPATPPPRGPVSWKQCQNSARRKGHEK